MQDLFIRDELTAKYLEDHGLQNVTRVSDPAFVLKPATSVEIDLPPGSKVLGLNISPLVEADRAAQGRESLVDVAQAYVRTILRETDFGVVLIPHVFPLSGEGGNDDRRVLRAVYQAFSSEDRVRLVDAQLNASQLKAIIAACHLFVGARTHATIAAMSSARPTISLSYSVKARGINRDAFGQEDLVLDARKVTAEELWRLTAHMASQEQELGQVLATRLPGLRERARSAGFRVAEALGAWRG
jgi:colanic acid/amylovoran biosynthesis protein